MQVLQPFGHVLGSGRKKADRHLAIDGKDGLCKRIVERQLELAQ